MPEPLIQINNLVKTYETPAGPRGILQGIERPHFAWSGKPRGRPLVSAKAYRHTLATRVASDPAPDRGLAGV